MARAAVAAGFATAAAAAGPYKSVSKTFTYAALDSSDRTIDVVYPSVSTAQAAQKFPLISYAHGYGDSGYSSYTKLFDDLVSYGYVVAATRSCKSGCKDDCKSESGDPGCFGHYYKEQGKVIEWALSSAATGLPINTSAVAAAGHSMGGQATLFTSHYNDSSKRVKAVAMHHAFTHTYPAPQVPFLAFTGTTDLTAPSSMADKFYNAAGAHPSKGLINKVGANHHEPTTSYNPKLALYTVAWFKVFVDETPQAFGLDFDNMLFGTGADSVCGGDDGKMKECEVHRG